jgi:hypothetical protein
LVLRRFFIFDAAPSSSFASIVSAAAASEPP